MLTLLAYVYGLVAFETSGYVKEVMLLRPDIDIMKLHLHLLSTLDIVGTARRRPFPPCRNISGELIWNHRRICAKQLDKTRTKAIVLS